MRTPIQAMVTLGGLAALSWEVLWQLQASLALGVSALGTAITLAATMAGMTAGALAAGRWLRSRTVAQPVRLYGGLELVIGISGLLMLPGFEMLESLDTRLYALSPTFASPLHALGIVALLGPPTIAMGASIPVFERIGRQHRISVSTLYGLNTAGASLGVLLLSFALLPALGVTNACRAVAGLNLLVWLASRLVAPGTTSSQAVGGEEAPARTHAPLRFETACLLAAGTGFVTFGLEVAWFRSLRAAFQSTTDGFAIMLASVLVPLAIGARAVPWLRRRGLSPGLLLGCAAAAILLATPLVERMDLLARVSGGYWLVLGKWLALSLAILGTPIFFLGTVLPWCLDEFSEPQAVGRLYGLNTLGAVAGALLAAWGLLPTLGFARCAWLLGLVVVGLALVAGGRRARAFAAAAGAASLAIAVTQTASLGRDRIQWPGRHRPYRIVAYHEGPDATASVLEFPRGRRALFIDGFMATTEQRNSSYMLAMGHVPMLMHPDPQEALVICFGTGQTVHGVRSQGVGGVDVVDVNPAVIGMAHHFPSNHAVLDDPRVRPIVMDGRAWVRRTQRRYDVITLEPMPPHFAGMNSLYSRGFYELLAESLEPQGVAAQWLPFHLLPPYYAASVATTFQAVFPDSVLWVDPLSGTGILVGRRAGNASALGSDWPGFERGHESGYGLSNDQIRRSLTLDAEGLARFASAGDVITDDNQLLAYGRLLRDYGNWDRKTAQLHQDENMRRISAIVSPPD
jgi:spermidine synthase